MGTCGNKSALFSAIANTAAVGTVFGRFAKPADCQSADSAVRTMPSRRLRMALPNSSSSLLGNTCSQCQENRCLGQAHDQQWRSTYHRRGRGRNRTFPRNRGDERALLPNSRFSFLFVAISRSSTPDVYGSDMRGNSTALSNEQCHISLSSYFHNHFDRDFVSRLMVSSASVCMLMNAFAADGRDEKCATTTRHTFNDRFCIYCAV
jgi:hypothetical protein